MMKESKRFYSKILLFGEYALMAGSEALSIPYSKLEGAFAFQPQQQTTLDSNSHLKKYAAYLRQLSQKKHFSGKLDVAQFENDVNRGLVFNSNIPSGYGLGSSGALVAAVYDRYGRDKIPADDQLSNEKLAVLKQTMAEMESWFHGKSSGLDPLICYLQKAVKVESDNRLKIVDLPHFETASGGAVFLLDTEMTGETQPLVRYFVKQCEDPAFSEKLKTELIPLNSGCIRSYLAGDALSLLPVVEKLSAFTLQYFRPMIPEKLLPLWQKGLENNLCSLKLCGSGGGGMMLGFTRDFEQTKNFLKPFSLQIVQQF
jgi:mevalonate kinase